MAETSYHTTVIGNIELVLFKTGAVFFFKPEILFVSQVIYMNHSFQSLNSVCIKCTTDFLSFDDFVGDAFDEGVRHRRPSFHKVPPIKRKVEKVL